MKRLLAAALALSLAGCASMTAPSAPNSSWIGVWGGSPAPSTSASKTFEDQTVRQVVRISAGGTKVRIRFTNEYSDTPLAIGAATIVKASPDGSITGTPIAITFSGAKSTLVPAKAPLLSDPVDLSVAALDSLSISIFLPKATGPCTCHPLGVATTWVSAIGDYTAAGKFEPTSTFTSRAFIAGIEVTPTAPKPVIVTFGDSITDGARSTNDKNARWPDILAQRLVAQNGPAVVNAAISGNRVLAHANAVFGENALSRLDRDVFSIPGVRWMTVLEGINDIGQARPNPPSAEQIIAGYKQIIDRAHVHGIKVIGATLLPYEGAAYHDPTGGEPIRQAVNSWIRTSNAFDGVIDFDKVMQDPANPKKMKADLQSGDWLHPNDAGYKVMGESIDLSLFK